MYFSFLACIKTFTTVNTIASIAHGGERAREEAFLGNNLSLRGSSLNGFMTHKNIDWKQRTLTLLHASSFTPQGRESNATKEEEQEEELGCRLHAGWFDTCQHAAVMGHTSAAQRSGCVQRRRRSGKLQLYKSVSSWLLGLFFNTFCRD